MEERFDDSRILLCEDDENLGMLLREYLEAKNFKVDLCIDGQEGYDAFQENQYDLCILDGMLLMKKENRKAIFMSIFQRKMFSI